ncbi:hypothetical protein BU26DRAFT_514089 [Trematosphaeria pertusa]|uniref:Uncharacterized protein n=1 Tax=Trematosphaeria pertusa TaxID=390896 RepID=A0A6A6J7H8_9PLEO|nr:uncharacterized protein BU26DRAFT_514089 [Trematosphaeria pertusa]KAF2257403.1 hypothetical protein BU26DRAFT_514089 [Trematosphaeria pertusa]
MAAANWMLLGIVTSDMSEGTPRCAFVRVVNWSRTRSAASKAIGGGKESIQLDEMVVPQDHPRWFMAFQWWILSDSRGYSSHWFDYSLGRPIQSSTLYP